MLSIILRKLLVLLLLLMMRIMMKDESPGECRKTLNYSNGVFPALNFHKKESKRVKKSKGKSFAVFGESEMKWPFTVCKRGDLPGGESISIWSGAPGSVTG